jgi:hypothetical protein
VANIETKERTWKGQVQRVFESLSRKPQTRLEVSVSANVPLQNVCRYIANFRACGTLIVLKKDTCPISGMTAEILSTNPDLINAKQLEMFQ